MEKTLSGQIIMGTRRLPSMPSVLDLLQFLVRNYKLPKLMVYELIIHVSLNFQKLGQTNCQIIRFILCEFIFLLNSQKRGK